MNRAHHNIEKGNVQICEIKYQGDFLVLYIGRRKYIASFIWGVIVEGLILLAPSLRR